MAPVGAGCRRALRKVLVSLGGVGCAVLVWGTEAVHGHPVYVGGEDNGVAILSHANTDFKAVGGSTAGGKVRSYLDFEAHGDLDAKGAMRHQGKDVATADDVADVERKAANATESLAASVQAHAKATGDGIARLNDSAVAAEAKIGTLETEMDAAEAKIGTLETEMDAAEVKIGTLESEMDTAETKIHILQGGVNAADSQILALAANVTDLQWDLYFAKTPPSCDWRFTARVEFTNGGWRCVCGWSSSAGNFQYNPTSTLSEDGVDWTGGNCSEQTLPVAALPRSVGDPSHSVTLDDGRLFAIWMNDAYPKLMEIDVGYLETKQVLHVAHGINSFRDAVKGAIAASTLRKIRLGNVAAHESSLYFVGPERLQKFDVDNVNAGLVDLGALPKRREAAAVAFFGTKLYVAGGGVYSNSWPNPTTLDSAIIVCDVGASSPTWVTLPAVLAGNGRTRMAWCSDDTRLYLVGGRTSNWQDSTGVTSEFTSSQATSAVYIDTIDNTVTSLPSLPAGREWIMDAGGTANLLHKGEGGDTKCAVLDDVLYIAGGTRPRVGAEASQPYSYWYTSSSIFSLDLATVSSWSEEDASLPAEWGVLHGTSMAASIIPMGGKKLWVSVSPLSGAGPGSNVVFEPGWKAPTPLAVGGRAALSSSGAVTPAKSMFEDLAAKVAALEALVTSVPNCGDGSVPKLDSTLRMTVEGWKCMQPAPWVYGPDFAAFAFTAQLVRNSDSEQELVYFWTNRGTYGVVFSFNPMTHEIEELYNGVGAMFFDSSAHPKWTMLGDYIWISYAASNQYSTAKLNVKVPAAHQVVTTGNAGRWHAQVGCGSKLYATSGLNSGSSFWELDVNAASPAWVSKRATPGGKLECANEKVYAVGAGGTDAYLQLHRYDNASNLWKTLSSMPGYSRMNFFSAGLGGKIYVTSDDYPNPASDPRTLVYDPATESWSFGGAMMTPSTDRKTGSGSKSSTVAGGKWYITFPMQIFDPSV